MLGRASRRIALVATMRAALRWMPAPITLIVLAAMFGWLRVWTWERWGYVLVPEVEINLRIGLLAAGLVGTAIAVLMILRARRNAGNFVEVAERVDRKLGAHEAIVTLAT